MSKYNCTLCGKGFISAYKLKMHLNRKVPCDLPHNEKYIYFKTKSRFQQFICDNYIFKPETFKNIKHLQKEMEMCTKYNDKCIDELIVSIKSVTDILNKPNDIKKMIMEYDALYKSYINMSNEENRKDPYLEMMKQKLFSLLLRMNDEINIIDDVEERTSCRIIYTEAVKEFHQL
jgi:hypothetical protein